MPPVGGLLQNGGTPAAPTASAHQAGIARRRSRREGRRKPEYPGLFQTILPAELERQLNLPGSGQRGSNDPGAWRNGSGRSERSDNRPSEIGVVEGVEELGPELKRRALTEMEGLEQRTIQLQQAWSRENVPAGIAERTSRWEKEGGWIEPLGWGALDQGAGETRFQGDPVRVSRVAVGGLIESHQRREGKTGLSDDDGVELPPAKNRIRDAPGASENGLAVPDGQLVAEIPGYAMGDVEIRRPPIQVRIARVQKSSSSSQSLIAEERRRVVVETL